MDNKTKKAPRKCLHCKGDLKVNYFYHTGCIPKVEELKGWTADVYNNGSEFALKSLKRSRRPQ